MDEIRWGAMLVSGLVSSGVTLGLMYLLLPAMGLPRLDFAAIAAGWIRATGKHARLFGIAVFLVGGVGWAFLYAAFWPGRGVLGGAAFGLVPFAIAGLTILPELTRFRVAVQPMPGFVWVKEGGYPAIAANLIEHIAFGICLGLIYG